jgi:hypothetical protein
MNVILVATIVPQQNQILNALTHQGVLPVIVSLAMMKMQVNVSVCIFTNITNLTLKYGELARTNYCSLMKFDEFRKYHGNVYNTI